VVAAKGDITIETYSRQYLCKRWSTEPGALATGYKKLFKKFYNQSLTLLAPLVFEGIH